MRIVLIKDMRCNGFYVGDTFEYLDETPTHYLGWTSRKSKIRVPKNRAEIDYSEEIDKLNESIDIREGVKKLLDEKE